MPVPVPVPVPEKGATGGAEGRRVGTMLDHERLDVYHLALDFLVFANGVIEALPRGRRHSTALFPGHRPLVVSPMCPVQFVTYLPGPYPRSPGTGTGTGTFTGKNSGTRPSTTPPLFYFHPARSVFHRRA